MLRVAVVPSHPFQVGLGTDFRTTNQIFELVNLNQGVEMYYVSPFKNYSSPPTNDSFHYVPISRYPGLYERFYRLTRKVVNNHFWARQLLHSPAFLEMSSRKYSKSLEPVLKKLDVDVILAIHHVAAAACLELKNKLGVRVVTDIHGIWAEESILSGAIASGSRQSIVARNFESRVIEESDFLVTTGDDLKSYISEHYGVAPSRITPIIPCMEPKVKNAKMVTDPSKVVFSGTSTYREKIGLLLEAMSMVTRRFPNVDLYMTKKGDSLRETERTAKALGLRPNFFFYPSPNEFYDFLKTCHIGVITSSDDITRKIAYPSKIYDYMSVGLPIVANDVGAWSKFLRESRCAVLTDGNPEGFAKGITEMFEHPEMIHELGQNGLDYLENVLQPRKIVHQLYNVLKKAAE